MDARPDSRISVCVSPIRKARCFDKTSRAAPRIITASQTDRDHDLDERESVPPFRDADNLLRLVFTSRKLVNRVIVCKCAKLATDDGAKDLAATPRLPLGKIASGTIVLLREVYPVVLSVVGGISRINWITGVKTAKSELAVE